MNCIHSIFHIRPAIAINKPGIFDNIVASYFMLAAELLFNVLGVKLNSLTKSSYMRAYTVNFKLKNEEKS